MKRCLTLAAVACAAVLLAGCATQSESGTTLLQAPFETGFVSKTLDFDGQARLYVVYVPPEYDPAKPWPMVLFLHGMGQRGSDGTSQSKGELGKAIRNNPDRFPCIVVMPQCPSNSWWHKEMKFLDALVARTRGEYRIDPERIYLTGLSMGGFGSWYYGARRTDLFAAIMPIAGGGNLEDVPNLVKVPIWAFHGDKDNVVPVDRSRSMVAAIKAAGGNIRYTEYPGVAHSSWNNAYNDPEVIAWMLAQTKHPGKTPAKK